MRISHKHTKSNSGHWFAEGGGGVGLIGCLPLPPLLVPLDALSFPTSTSFSMQNCREEVSPKLPFHPSVLVFYLTFTKDLALP